MAERILTLHPDGKQGVNIDQWKYDMVREAILSAVEEHQVITFTNLMEEVGRRVDDTFEGSIAWYTTSVKLDLEARGTIERIPKKSPQQIRLGTEIK
ncbi:MAG: hypothetical protein AB8G95_25085 [Anaerolineae bacterium]